MDGVGFLVPGQIINKVASSSTTIPRRSISVLIPTPQTDMLVHIVLFKFKAEATDQEIKYRQYHAEELILVLQQPVSGNWRRSARIRPVTRISSHCNQEPMFPQKTWPRDSHTLFP
jgi:hypothetical protein